MKEMKTKSKISGHIIRGGACAVFLSVAFTALSSASNSPNVWQRSAGTTGADDTTGKSPSQARAFSFPERVAYQRAIGDVYWRHRIWPKENPDRKPSLDAVISQAQLENKVASYLRDSLALEDHGQPITAEQLQAEMDRMATDTKQPDVLRELFEALGNDPVVIAECLARPVLAERLIANFSAQEQTRHVESPQNEQLLAMSILTTLGHVYTLPEIADTCADDTWTATTTVNAPSARFDHTAVWTGSEMIVWGGWKLAANIFRTGGKYTPSTDSWTVTSTTNAPTARYTHSAVWTGTEMIVWGGDGQNGPFNTGGRYNPSTNSWTTTSTTNAPTGRFSQTAIWAGSEMIVWGGVDDIGNRLNTGGRYNPTTDSWIATSTTNAPTSRALPSAVWTGSEMIVWGGTHDHLYLNSGGRYNPNTDSWTATSLANAPTGREAHTAVWTGSEMIVWGGFSNGLFNRSGGIYNPGTNTWTATSTTRAPAARDTHTAVWNGSEMIVWGGGTGRGLANTGGTYNPSTDTWVATSTINAPTARHRHTAVWTGSEMIVWGGEGSNSSFFRTGGRYCAKPPQPSITIIQPNGGEVWTAGSVQQIRWNSNLEHTDHLIIQYSRDGGASWFRIAQDIPAFTVGYWWHVDNFPTTQGRVKILLQEDRSVTDQSDANFTVQRP
jgi:N-acetylneuraminic acid mutarotase